MAAKPPPSKGKPLNPGQLALAFAPLSPVAPNVYPSTTPWEAPPTKWGTIRAAEDALLPAEVAAIKPPPTKKTKKLLGPGVITKTTSAAKAEDDRYQAALKSNADPTARAKLIKTMTPARRREILTKQADIKAADAQFRSNFVPPPSGGWLGTGIDPGLGLDRLRTGALGSAKVIRATQDPNTYLNVGKAGLYFGADAAKPLAQRGLGMLLQVTDGMAAFRGQQTEASSVLPGATSTKLRGAAIPVSPSDVQAVAEAIPKIALGFGISPVGMIAHPISTAQQVIDFIRGGGAAAVAIGALIASEPVSRAGGGSNQSLHAAIDAIYKLTVDQFKQMYGNDASYRDVAKGAYQDQSVLYFLNGLAFYAPSVKAATAFRYYAAGAKTWEEAFALARDPHRLPDYPHVEATHKPRMLTVKGKESPDFQVEAIPSRDPGVRIFQKGYDVATGAIDKGWGKKLPVAQSKRALRIQSRQLRREVHRLTAEGAALWSVVDRYLKENPEQGPRLFHTLQRPADIPEDVWLQTVATDIETMLAGRPMPSTAGDTVTEAKLQRRLDRFKKDVGKVTRNQWMTKVSDVYNEQHRLGLAIVNTNDSLKAMRANERILQEPNAVGLDDLERGKKLNAAREDIKVLLTRRDALKSQLDELSVDQAPVESNTRTDLIQAMQDAPLISDEEIAGLLDVLDTLARKWGQEHGRDPGEYYADPTGLGVDGVQWIEHKADLPEGALTQKIKPTLREAHTPEHQKSVDRLYAAEGRYQATEDRRSVENKAINDRRAANKVLKAKGEELLAPYERDPELTAIAEELRAAQEQELYDRLWFGSNTYRQGDNFVSNPERAALAKDLVAHRGGRTGALPPGVTEPRQLEQLMSLLEELRHRGRKARFWYRDSGRAILRMAGGDKKVAANIAQLVAIYSPQKAVIPNLSEAIKAYQSWKATGHVSNGQDWQMDAAENVLEGRGGWDGRKTNNFYGNLLQHIDKKAFKAEGFTGDEVTADMWMARVFGYLQKNVSGGRYDVVERAVRQLAKEQKWKPQEAQAAIWTAIKDLSDDVSANVDFATAVSRHEGQLNYELAPGRWTGPFKKVYASWAPETQQAFLNANMPLIDDFFDEVGVLHQASELGPGVYGGVAAPGARAQIFSSGAAYKVSRDERTLFNFVAASIGRATLQEAVPWMRGFIATTRGHADTIWINLGRGATAEEAARVYKILNADPKDEQVLVVHAGNEGLLLRKAPWIDNADFPNYERGKVKYPASFQGRAQAAAESAFGEDVNLEHFVADGEMPENNWRKGTTDYDRIIDESLAERTAAESRSRQGGDPGISAETVRLRGAADRLAVQTGRIRDEFTADPDAATARYGVKRDDTPPADGSAPVAAGPRGPPDLGTPPQMLHQVRGEEIKGAVQFLNTDDGQRILYLTEHADVSTILHELIGHGVRPMKDAYPQEFAKVEDWIGRPLEEWTVDDHERFARMTESYFSSGVAPVPELVDTFRHLQVWMRAVRGEAEKRVPVPPAVSDLLDTYLGAFDDENVFRVATIAARIPDETKVGRAQALYDFTGEELAALRRRNEVRAYNRSIEKLEKDATALSEKADRTDEEQLLMEAKLAQAGEMRAAQMIAEADRQHHLRNRYAEIETALATPTGEGYSGAVEALQGLITMREDILRSVFGDKYDDTFSNRVDLLADYMADQGLIPAGFARGTAWYVPHRPQGIGKHARKIQSPANPLEGGVIGKTDQSALGLHSRNNLIRWQSGDYEADPLVVMEAWQNAQAFLAVKTLKDMMWDVGRDITAFEAIPADVVVINRDGIPIPAMQRRSMTPGSTSDVQRVMDALEGRDPDAMLDSLEKYFNDIVMDPDTANQLRRDMADDFGKLNLRVVDKSIVEALFRPLRGGTSKWGKALDYGNLVARWSLIYTNPAYIPYNLLANGIFLAASGGAKMLSDWTSASKMLLQDEQFRIRVGGQVGELPALAGVQQGRGVARAVDEKNRWALNKISIIPDRYPRAVAWVAEAKKSGYRTKAEMNRLIDGGTPHLDRQRRIVSDRATNIMVDFDAASDAERQVVTRAIFIWPWIRGATRWPFYYAREFPLRAAIGGNVGAATEQRRQQIMGDVRPGYRELFPISKKGQFVREINVGPLSPGSTAAGFLEAALGNFQSAIQGKAPVAPGERIADFISPWYELAGHAAFGITGFGQTTKPTRDTLINDLLNFFPYGATGRQILDPSTRPKSFNERGVKSVLERKFVRMVPQTVDLNRLHAFQSQGRLTGEEAVARSVADLTKQAKSIGADPPPASVVHALRIQQAIRDEVAIRKHDKGQSTSWHPDKPNAQPTLTDSEEADAIFDVLSKYYPNTLGKLDRPSTYRPGVRMLYVDALLYGNNDLGVPEGVLDALTTYRGAVSAAARAKKLSG